MNLKNFNLKLYPCDIVRKVPGKGEFADCSIEFEKGILHFQLYKGDCLFPYYIIIRNLIYFFGYWALILHFKIFEKTKAHKEKL